MGMCHLADLLFGVSGPLDKSPVTGLARLPGRILWCVHMGNFNPVDRDEFKKQPKWCNINLFANVIGLLSLVTLIIKLFRILLK